MHVKLLSVKCRTRSTLQDNFQQLRDSFRGESLREMNNFRIVLATE